MCVNLNSTFGLSQNKCLSLSDFSLISCHLTNPDFFAASFTLPKDITGDKLLLLLEQLLWLTCLRFHYFNGCMSGCPRFFYGYVVDQQAHFLRYLNAQTTKTVPPLLVNPVTLTTSIAY